MAFPSAWFEGIDAEGKLRCAATVEFFFVDS